MITLVLICLSVFPAYAETGKADISGQIVTFDNKSDYVFEEAVSTFDTADTETYGDFFIQGNIADVSFKDGMPAYGIGSGDISLFYNYGDDILNADIDVWHLYEDKSNKAISTKLDSDILKGAYIVQTSIDGINWVTSDSETNIFSDVPVRTESIYITTEVQLNNGCYYRVIVLYQLRMKTGETKILFITKDNYEYKKVAEVYQFYAYDVNMVTPLEIVENNIEGTLIKNVAVGSGIIVVCVTVSIVTGATGLTTVSIIFTASAKAAKTIAVSSSLFSGITSGLIEAYRTGDIEQAFESAALSASKSFKWGAIAGSVTGAAAEAYKFKVAADATKGIPTPRESELKVSDKYPGKKQVSYLNGQEVPFGTKGSTRPDVIVENNGLLEAIEVKNYELKGNTHQLYKTLRAQVEQRVQHLPKGATQKVVLDVRGRNYSDELLNYVIKKIQENCYDVYPNLPVEIIK